MDGVVEDGEAGDTNMIDKNDGAGMNKNSSQIANSDNNSTGGNSNSGSLIVIAAMMIRSPSFQTNSPPVVISIEKTLSLQRLQPCVFERGKTYNVKFGMKSVLSKVKINTVIFI